MVLPGEQKRCYNIFLESHEVQVDLLHLVFNFILVVDCEVLENISHLLGGNERWMRASADLTFCDQSWESDCLVVVFFVKYLED